jgi:hypothetical protein
LRRYIEDKELYKRTKSFSIENHSVRIKNLALSPSEENLVGRCRLTPG